MDEVRNKALRFIRLEEDKKVQQRIDGVSEYDNPNRKSESSSKHYRSKPYSRNDSKKVHFVDDDEDDEDYPKLNEYCFSVSTSELIYAMQGLGEKARWPRKTDKNTGWKDKSKWCAFHEDFGHVTEDCIALRKEISYLLSKGHLKELLGKKKDKHQDTDRNPEKNPRRAASPPPDASIVYFISGGSDICGTSYSAAKRHAKEAKSEKGDRPGSKATVSEGKVISFDDEDMNNV